MTSFKKLTFVVAACLVFTNVNLSDAQTSSLPSQMPGLALAEQTADVSSVVSQRLIEMHVKEGQRVKKGQLLATLEYSIVQAEFEAAKAIANDHSGVNVATVDLEEASSRLERFRRALSTGAGNQMELKQAENAYSKAASILEQQKSLLVRAQKSAETAAAQLEGYRLRAPFDGMVTEQHVSVGNIVESGSPIVSVVGPKTLRVELNLSLELFGKMQRGKDYQMQAGAPVSEMLDARLKFVSPVIDSASQSFRCVFEIDNSSFTLPAGFPIQLSNDQLGKLLQNSQPADVATE